MDTTLLSNRLAELDGEISRLKALLASAEAEKAEIEVAERVLTRLAAAKILTPDTRERQVRIDVGEAEHKTKKTPTVRLLVYEALMDARQRGLPGLTPQGIRGYIKAMHGREIGPQINTVASRMWRDVREIEKDEEAGLFRLPSKDDAGHTPSKAKAEHAGGMFSFLEPNPARDGA